MPPAESARPRLTEARIDHVLRVAGELRGSHPELADYLDDINTVTGRDVESGRMLPPSRVIGAAAAQALDARGEPPTAFVRDLFWIRLVAQALWRPGSVAEKLREGERDFARLRLISWNADARRTLKGLEIVQTWYQDVTPADEAAVRARYEDVLDVAFTTLYRPGREYPFDSTTR